MRNHERTGGGWQMMGTGAAIAAVVLALVALFRMASMGDRLTAVGGAVDSNSRSIRKLQAGGTGPVATNDSKDIRRSLAELDAQTRRLGEEVSALRHSNSTGPSAATVDQMMALVRSLTAGVSEARGIAEGAAAKAAQAERAAAAAGAVRPAPAGASTAELAQVAGDIAALKQEVAELKKKPPVKSTGTAPRINEAALRQMVRGMVQKEVEKAFTDMRNRWRGGGRRGN